MGDTWARVRGLFEQAVDLPAGERSAFLDAACADDAVLRRAIDALIEADEQAGAFLDEPVFTPPATPTDGGSESLEDGLPPSPSRPSRGATKDASSNLPDSIGPYRIVRSLGRGGMGEVYLALRDDAFQRRVVIKCVRTDRESPEMLRRLRAERQILASLDHPNIARLYDGGQTPDGRPYFVLEYIDGLPIDRYCDDHRLTVDERLVLFRKVCAAVQSAHQNLVVHRDLKPSNILVTADGDPKLLDFGIAKLLNPEIGAPELAVTATWLRLMTPQYASPEQVRGKLVTTASDVYSLGVLLFELLTGLVPFDFSRRSPREIERVLSDHEPPRPSTVVVEQNRLDESAPVGAASSSLSTSGSEPGSKAAAGTTTQALARARARAARPRELGRRLAGDLDAIVLKALRAAPQRRYGSVEAFSVDLERFQKGLPVLARRGSWRYRLGRFVLRHRIAVAVAASTLVVLALFVASSYRQAERVAAERDQALLEQQRKETVTGLLLDILSVADPYSGDGETLSVREALEASAPSLRRRLRDQPALRAEVLYSIGLVRTNLGLWQQARADLEEALRLRRGLHGVEHPDVALAASALAVALAELGDDGARELAESAAPLVADGDLPIGQRLAVANRVVGVSCRLGQAGEAAEMAETAVTLARIAPEQHLDGLSTALGLRASVHLAEGETLQAAESLRQARAIDEQLHGADDLRIAVLSNNLGSALRRAGLVDEAEAAFRRTLAIQRAKLRPENPQIAVTLNNLGGIAGSREDWRTAIEHWREARGLIVGQAGRWHPRVLFLDLKIARARIASVMQADAARVTEIAAVVEQLQRERSEWSERLGAYHRFVVEIDHVLARAALADGREDVAVVLFERYLASADAEASSEWVAEATETLEALRARRAGRPRLVE